MDKGEKRKETATKTCCYPYHPCQAKPCPANVDLFMAMIPQRVYTIKSIKEW